MRRRPAAKFVVVLVVMKLTFVVVVYFVFVVERITKVFGSFGLVVEGVVAGG